MSAIVLWVATSSAVDDTETFQPPGTVTAIEVDVDAGAISVEFGDEVRVDVARQAGRLAGSPTVTAETSGGVLRVSGTCPARSLGRCDTSVSLVLPAMTAIDLSTGAGPIDGTLPHGVVRARTSAGPIALVVTEDVSELAVLTAAGTIDLVVPDASYDVTAETEVGRVDVDVSTVADAPRSIRARSDVGSIRIRTPE